MGYVIAPPPQSSLPVAGSDDRFPVRRVYCVGRNYAAHAREMGHDPDREAPFFFQKPADALVPGGGTIPFPPATADLHHEVELVVALKGGGRDIADAAAMDLVWGVAVGLDLTRRDLQGAAKKQGRPWEMGKAFDRSAPCGPLTPLGGFGAIADQRIGLTVDGEIRQDGRLSDMIWSVPETIAVLSTLVELVPGDLIFTGTPDGVGPIRPGQTLVATVDGLVPLTVTIG